MFCLEDRRGEVVARIEPKASQCLHRVDPGLSGSTSTGLRPGHVSSRWLPDVSLSTSGKQRRSRGCWGGKKVRSSSHGWAEIVSSPKGSKRGRKGANLLLQSFPGSGVSRRPWESVKRSSQQCGRNDQQMRCKGGCDSGRILKIRRAHV